MMAVLVFDRADTWLVKVVSFVFGFGFGAVYQIEIEIESWARVP